MVDTLTVIIVIAVIVGILLLYKGRGNPRRIKSGKRIIYPTNPIIGYCRGGMIRIRDLFPYGFDEGTKQQMIRILFIPGSRFEHNHRDELANARRDRNGLRIWDVPKSYTLEMTTNPLSKEYLILCDYPHNRPTLYDMISQESIHNLNVKEKQITLLTEQVNTLQAENYEIASQSTTMQLLVQKIEELKHLFIQVLTRTQKEIRREE